MVVSDVEPMTLKSMVICMVGIERKISAAYCEVSSPVDENLFSVRPGKDKYSPEKYMEIHGQRKMFKDVKRKEGTLLKKCVLSR